MTERQKYGTDYGAVCTETMPPCFIQAVSIDITLITETTGSM